MSTVEERNLRMGAHRPHVIGGWDVRTATATQEWRQGARAESRWQGAGGPPGERTGSRRAVPPPEGGPMTCWAWPTRRPPPKCAFCLWREGVFP